jgi:hypothetical protein
MFGLQDHLLDSWRAERGPVTAAVERGAVERDAEETG